MSDPQTTDAPDPTGASGADPLAATDHGDAHGHDDHGHGESALGPIDTAAWGAGILGVGIAAVMAICFAMATSGVG
jgi:hypothetical protein